MSGSVIFAFAVIIVLLLYFATVRHNLNERQRLLTQSYMARRALYREWLARYGRAARPQMKKFLRCFADAFWVPPEVIHKLGPDDNVLEYYHRDYRPGEPDCLETKLFSDLLQKEFKYTPVEEDGVLTMGQLFEKITGITQKSQHDFVDFAQGHDECRLGNCGELWDLDPRRESDEVGFQSNQEFKDEMRMKTDT